MSLTRLLAEPPPALAGWEHVAVVGWANSGQDKTSPCFFWHLISLAVSIPPDHLRPLQIKPLPRNPENRAHAARSVVQQGCEINSPISPAGSDAKGRSQPGSSCVTWRLPRWGYPEEDAILTLSTSLPPRSEPLGCSPPCRASPPDLCRVVPCSRSHPLGSPGAGSSQSIKH